MSTTLQDDAAVRWLLQSKDPSIRYLTLSEVLGRPSDSTDVEAAKRLISRGNRVRSLLSGQRRDGGFGVHPYQKWTGSHWRLVSLVELAIPRGHRKALKAVTGVLNWLLGDSHLHAIKRINGLTRRCASQEGNALAVCSSLGIAERPQVRTLVESLIEWQWPDGGWNCDKRQEADHSSFYESLAPLWGLVRYHKATGDRGAKKAADKTAELFLAHHLFRSDKTGEAIDQEWLKLHYPLYWHYDILQALRVLSEAGKLEDPRTEEALRILESKRSVDGLWSAEARYWNLRRKVPVKGKGPLVSNVEVVDWGRHGPNEMVTLNALRVLKAAGRLQ